MSTVFQYSLNKENFVQNVFYSIFFCDLKNIFLIMFLYLSPHITCLLDNTNYSPECPSLQVGLQSDAFPLHHDSLYYVPNHPNDFTKGQ